MSDMFKETIMSDEARSKFIREMMAVGLSRDAATQVIDLAVHAELETMRTWERVVMAVAGHTPDIMAVMSLSLGMIKGQVSCMENSLLNMAQEEGANIIGDPRHIRGRVQ